MTAFPQFRRRRIVSVIGAATLLAGLVTIPAVAANAATPTSDSSSQFTVQTLRQHVQHVHNWSDQHTAPYRPAGQLTQQQFLDYSQKMADYWGQVPWTDFYGQYGCTVKDVDVAYHDEAGDWGAAGAMTEVSYDCDDSPALQEVTPDAVDDVAPPATTDTTDASALPVATQALSADGSIDLAGTIGGAATCGLSGSHHSVCVSVPVKGTLVGSETNLNNKSDTGHLRLGNVGMGGTCGAGSLVGNSSTRSVPAGGYFSVSLTINSTSKWSAQWYDPNETSQACGTY